MIVWNGSGALPTSVLSGLNLELVQPGVFPTLVVLVWAKSVTFPTLVMYVQTTLKLIGLYLSICFLEKSVQIYKFEFFPDMYLGLVCVFRFGVNIQAVSFYGFGCTDFLINYVRGFKHMTVKNEIVFGGFCLNFLFHNQFMVLQVFISHLNYKIIF